MADGTTINVFVKHLHKTNAQSVLYESKEFAEYLETKIVAMAATNGNSKDDEGVYWYEHVVQELPALLQEYYETRFKEYMAQILIDFPEDCDDELENIDETLY